MLDSDSLGYAIAKLPLLRHSKVSRSKMGALKVMIFWAIDGPEFRGIKRKQFRGKKGDSKADEHKERQIERDW